MSSEKIAATSRATSCAVPWRRPGMRFCRNSCSGPFERFAVEVGHDVARRDVEHADAFRRPFDRETARHRADGGFGRAVGEVALDADLVEERADVDDGAAAGFDEMRIRLAARGEHRGRVGLHHPLVSRGRQFVARRIEVDAGVVDQPVQPACSSDRFERCAHARFIGDVAGVVHQAATEFGGASPSALRRGG